MKTIIFLLLFAINLTPVIGQLGVSVSLNRNNIHEWDAESLSFAGLDSAHMKMFKVSYGLGLGYLLRLENIRIDFYPNINYSHSKDDLYNSWLSQTELYKVKLRLNQLDFNIQTKIYLLDLVSLNQPKLNSKQDRILKEGFYLIINPSISLLNTSSIGGLELSEQREFNYETFHVRSGIGFGFDLFIKKNIIISPFLIYSTIYNVSNRLVKDHIAYVRNVSLSEDGRTTFDQVQFGLNFSLEGIILDKKIPLYD